MKGLWASVAALALWGVTASSPVSAAGTVGDAREAPDPAPTVAIIIDDLGDRLDYGLRAVRMSAALTCAFLPYAPYTTRLARLAHDQGKEVMVHLPMQATGHHRLGRGGLQVTMSRSRFVNTVRGDLRAVPYASGVNNHMGSLLTQYRSRMGWLMEELRDDGRGMFFVDSHTTPLTVARDIAVQKGVPALMRDVFLDTVPEPSAIRNEFERLLALARSRGTAVAIAHPYPETLSFLERRLPQLAADGVRLVPVSTLVRSAGFPVDAPDRPGRLSGDNQGVVAVTHTAPENSHRSRGGGHYVDN